MPSAIFHAVVVLDWPNPIEVTSDSDIYAYRSNLILRFSTFRKTPFFTGGCSYVEFSFNRVTQT